MEKNRDKTFRHKLNNKGYLKQLALKNLFIGIFGMVSLRLNFIGGKYILLIAPYIIPTGIPTIKPISEQKQ